MRFSDGFEAQRVLLNPDGSRDTSSDFAHLPGGFVSGVDADGNFLVTGSFIQLGGVLAPGLARVLPQPAARRFLSLAEATVIVQEGAGPAP